MLAWGGLFFFFLILAYINQVERCATQIFLQTKIACIDTFDIKHLYRNMTAARVYTKFEIKIINVWFLTNVAS